MPQMSNMLYVGLSVGAHLFWCILKSVIVWESRQMIVYIQQLYYSTQRDTFYIEQSYHGLMLKADYTSKHYEAYLMVEWNIDDSTGERSHKLSLRLDWETTVPIHLTKWWESNILSLLTIIIVIVE